MDIERPTERRLVTCVFIDIVGSTDLTTRVGPERMRRLLDDAFAEISARAAAEGGTVEKFIGDAVFILFGAPVSHRDDAVRALRVAEVCLRWVATSGTSLRVRIGIETGEALVDLAALDARQRMAVGTCVNVAARLQQSASPGQVLVGPTCRDASGDSAEFDAAADVELKGLGRVAASRFRRLRQAPERSAPFVGRGEDLARLRAAFERSARGRAAFLLVTGEPGIGKTRLVDELVREITGRAAVIRARCRPGTEVGTSMPLRQLVGDRTADLPAVIAHAIGLSRDARLLALNAADRQNEIDVAWRDYLTRLTAHGPVVICVDDIHWAEPETVRVLDRATFRNDVPLCVIATARPEFPGLTAVRPGEDRITVELAPLRETDAQALARSVGGAAERAARAAGNPLFILELARAKAGPGVAVPLTLQAAIAARLDELEFGERDLLQRVSIVGDTVALRDAALLTDRTPSEAAGMLGRLAHLQYLEPVGGAFRYHHVLLRDAAYGRLPAELRLRLHAKYAGAGIDPADVEALAHHWWEAIGGAEAEWVWSEAERDAMRGEALAAHIAAGERLGDRLAAQRMVTTFERALRLATTPKETAQVERGLGQAYARIAKGEDATVHRIRAIGLLKSAGEVVPAQLYADMLDLPVNNWGYFRRMPSTEEMVGLIDEGIAAARTSGERLQLLRLLVHRAFFAGDRRVVGEIDEIVRAAAGDNAYADALWRLALLYAVELNDIDRACSAIDLSVDLAARGAEMNEPEAVMWRAIVRFHAGDLRDAERDAERLDVLSRTKSTHTQQHALGAKALIAFARGDWAAVAAYGDDLRTLAASDATATYCIWGANLIGWAGVADLFDRRELRGDLEDFAKRLLPEAPLTRSAALLLPLAMAGRITHDDEAARSYDSRTRIADRQAVLDLGGMNVVFANVVRQRWPAVESWLPRLDALAQRGAKFSGALATAAREEIAHARGGPTPRHEALRALGYAGVSEIMSYRAV